MSAVDAAGRYRVRMDPEARQEPQQRLFSPADLAIYLGVRVDTVYSWVSKGRLPYVKVGRLVRFDIRDIDTWIATCRHASVDQWFEAWKEGRVVRGRIVPPRPSPTLDDLEVKVPPPRRLLNVQEAAAYLRIEQSTLYTWSERGIIGRVKRGSHGYLRFRLEDLDQFIRVNRQRRKWKKRAEIPASSGTTGTPVNTTEV